MCADDFVLYGELEEDQNAMVRGFVEILRRRSLKANASKGKVMVIDEEEGLECEVCACLGI